MLGKRPRLKANPTAEPKMHCHGILRIAVILLVKDINSQAPGTVAKGNPSTLETRRPLHNQQLVGNGIPSKNG